MLDKFTYTNHLGEVITFGSSPYFANSSDLRDYQWSYDETLTRFDRGTVTKTLEVIVVGTEEDANEKKDALYEIFEKDVLAMKKGTFQVGEYKMNAFVYGSKKTDYLSSQKLLIVQLSVVTDTPQWRTEKTFEFPQDPSSPVGNPYLRRTISNDSLWECGFRLKFYGPAPSPAWVKIDGHMYSVDVFIDLDEYLEIVSDGTTKTITLYKSDDTTEDCFAKRYRSESVFAKISAGENIVECNNSFGFELTLLEERSEPKWTL